MTHANARLTSLKGTAAHANPILDFESAPVDAKALKSDPKDEAFSHSVAVADVDADGREPTADELSTLRKVSAGMPWPVRVVSSVRLRTS